VRLMTLSGGDGDDYALSSPLGRDEAQFFDDLREKIGFILATVQRPSKLNRICWPDSTTVIEDDALYGGLPHATPRGWDAEQIAAAKNA
jgi:hypothetical protein